MLSNKGGGRPTRLLPHAKMLLVPISNFSLLGRLCSGRFVLHFNCANMILAACFCTESSWHTYRSTVFVPRRHDLPSDARGFSLTSFEA